MDPRGSNLLFILGHYKSGSTWLVNLLSLHPAVRALRETQLFQYAFRTPDLRTGLQRLLTTPSWAQGGRRNVLRHRLVESLRPFRRKGQATLHWSERPSTLLDLKRRDQLRLERRLSECDDRDDFCRLFYSLLFEALRSPRYLVDKSVTSLQYVTEIKRVFPDSRLLAIHRDGRDVVVSDKFHQRNQYQREQVFSDSVRNWRQAIDLQREHSRSFEILSLSYETLLESPEKVTTELLQQLGLACDDHTVRDLVHRSSFEFVTGRALGDEDRGSFYRKGGSGDWVRHFSPAQVQQFSELAGDLLVTLGYEEDADWRTWPGTLGGAP
jgi:hypothetical protein